MPIIMDESASPKPAKTDFIKDGTTETFENDVIKASLETPVIVDMWADWCGPCKQLMPLLEKAVTATKGAVKLVKINADKNPQITSLLRVQSLPTVLAFFKGQPVDGFMGAQSEPSVKRFVEGLLKISGSSLPVDIKSLLDEADKARIENRLDEAEALYVQAMENDEGNVRAIGGFGQCFLARGDLEGARAFLKSLSPELYELNEIKSFRNTLKLMEKAGSGEDITPLEQELIEKPKSHEKRIELAEKYFALNEHEKSFDTLIDGITIDGKWNDGAFKTKLLELFGTLGHMHPATVAARRKLSSMLFN